MQSGCLIHEEPAKYEPPKYRVINWAIPLPGGTAFTDPAYATQLRACKLLFHRLQHEPAEGRRRWRSSTLRNAHSALRVLMPWMVAHGYRRFAELDDRTTRMFAAHLRQRKGRRGTLTPSGLVQHLSLLVALYEHRNELPDAPRIHPLGGETGSAFAGFQRSDEAPIPHIPDDIATHLIGEALTWVTRYAPVLLAAERTVFDSTLTEDATSPSMTFRRRREAGRGHPLASPIVWQGHTYTALPDVRALLRLRGHLVYACYIVIASHTGMRASEIGAMQSDCLETVASDGGQPLLFVRSRVFKTAAEVDGFETRWVAGRDRPGNPVRLAVQVMVELCSIHPAEAGATRAMGHRQWPLDVRVEE